MGMLRPRRPLIPRLDRPRVDRSLGTPYDRCMRLTSFAGSLVLASLLVSLPVVAAPKWPATTGEQLALEAALQSRSPFAVVRYRAPDGAATFVGRLREPLKS